MKKIAAIVGILVLTVPVLMGQEDEKVAPAEKQKRRPGEVQTIFDPNAGNGGYGAFSVGYTQINGRDALLMGGRGEWVVGHGFGLGFGGYGFVNDPIYNFSNDLNYSLAGGYGGLMMEPILFGWFPVHVAFPVLIGAGGVSSFSYVSNWTDPYEYYPANFEEATAFFVAEAGIELEFNLVRFFRLAIFGSYRYTPDINMIFAEPDALRGWSAGMTFKFGSF